MTPRSPLLDLPGAVEGDHPDSGVAAHYGNPVAEQRRLVDGQGWVDLSHRDVVRVEGADRLAYLHAMTTQAFEGLRAGTWTHAMVLSPQGHIEHGFAGVDDGTAFIAHTEPGAGPALIAFLEQMKFMLRVDSTLVPELAVLGRASGVELVPRIELVEVPARWGPPSGVWAHEALRIEAGLPRIGLDTDHRTIPNELGLLGSVVALDKGCYRGQETVARVHTLGRPPRRLVRLHLDGSVDHLPAVGSPLLSDGRQVGFVGSSARHHELGPIALGLVKRSVDLDTPLTADGVAAAQELVVDPDVGLHVRPALGR
ncbi:MAG: YgfZ/GcvT domain-containing protein [Nocardioidaceae bacterium]